MDYRRVYWGAIAALGALLLARHAPALLGSAAMAGNLPPVFGVLAGGVILLAGGRGLYLPEDAGGPESPSLGVALVVALALLQGLAVAGWLLGAGW